MTMIALQIDCDPYTWCELMRRAGYRLFRVRRLCGRSVLVAEG